MMDFGWAKARYIPALKLYQNPIHRESGGVRGFGWEFVTAHTAAHFLQKPWMPSNL